MTVYSGIEKEISAGAPCGPDPDADLDAQNFLFIAEGQLPTSYRDFNRHFFEARQTLADLRTRLEKSRDLRYLILAAKYHILSDDVFGFVDAIAATNTLLAARWDHCHPTEAAGGAELRSAYLASLDDFPTVVMPLQNATLINDKRLDALSMRSILVAERKLLPRDGEWAMEASSIKDAFMRFEPLQQMVNLSASLEGVLASLDSLHQLFIDKAGHQTAPQFEHLSELTRSIRAYIGNIIATREPGLAARVSS